MPTDPTPSIFWSYYGAPPEFVDRFVADPAGAVDVMIPTFNTNELWRANLLSVYREVPVRRLFIGDGGCTDDTVGIARTFPRVEIVDQSAKKTLGGCLRELIERVESEWFIYLHADVFLPEGWFDTMSAHQGEFDWFESGRQITVSLSYRERAQEINARPYSGSQMGRRSAFEPFLSKIDDDYLYRNEDLILGQLVEDHGGRYGKVLGTHHYHQIANKPGEKEPDFTRVSVQRDRDEEWLRRTQNMQIRGIIKYTSPTRDYMIRAVQGVFIQLQGSGEHDADAVEQWVSTEHPEWLPHLRRKEPRPGRRVMVRSGISDMARGAIKIVSALFFGNRG